MSIPTIALLKRTPLTSIEVQAFFYIEKLCKEQKIKLGTHIFPETLFIPDDSLSKSSALLCRPMWGGEVNLELINKLRDDKPTFYIATFSAGTDNIKISKKELSDNGIEIISSDGGNAPQTAELTIYLGITLLRKIQYDIFRMANNCFKRNSSKALHSLNDCVWTVLGRGNVAMSLISRLIGLGLSEIIIWNRTMNVEDFEKILKGIELNDDVYMIKSDNGKISTIVERGTGKYCKIVGTDDLDYALNSGNIISIHITLNEQTENFIDKDKLENIKPTAVLINASRHEIVNVKDVLNALVDNKIGGYGSDVIEKKAEKEGSSSLKSHSLLWQAYCYNLLCCEGIPSGIKKTSYAETEAKEFITFLGERKVEALNLLITPHIGGTTKDAEETIAIEVINTLMKKLVP